MEIELEARQRINFVGDGIQLTPRDVGTLVQAIADTRSIEIDVYSCGGIVQELEERFARELGKEQAVFLPTGTLANHFALRTLVGSGGRVFAQAESHVYRDSGNAPSILSGLTLIGLGEGNPGFTLEEFESALARNEEEKVSIPARALSIESPVRRFDGRCFDPRELNRILARARQAGLALHRDGARIHYDAAWNGQSVQSLTAPYDTVYCSLHKAFNANYGAVLAGPTEMIAPLHHTRRMFGASPARSWPQAAIALHFLEGFEQRLTRSVERSKELLAGLDDLNSFKVIPLVHGTHVTTLRTQELDEHAFRQRLKQSGIDLPRIARPHEFDLRVNESILHHPLDRTLAAFRSAAEEARR